MVHSPQQIQDHQDRLERFARMQDQGLEIPAIRERMGLSKGAAYRLASIIRKERDNG